MREALIQFFQSLLKEWLFTFWQLLKICIPVIIVTKIAVEYGLITTLSNLLDPVMGVVGLPGGLGIVWATGLLTNLYTAMVVFASLATELGLNVAQVTIICSMLLIAHALPLELAITRKAGGGLWAIALLRIMGALAYGYLLNTICTFFHVWQQPALIFFQVEIKDLNIVEWAVDQIRFLFLIGLLIFAILAIMRLLDLLGIIRFLERILEPLLKLLGMSSQAAPITVVGIVLGITYGGSLIIKESLLSRLCSKDLFFSLALMGLSHALVEDTLLMLAIGGKLAAILWGRLLFSISVIFLLVRLLDWLSPARDNNLTDS